MLTIDSIGPNRIDIALTGKINSDAMKTALDEMVQKSEGIKDGCMMYRIGDFDLPTLGAIAVEFSRLPALFKLIHQYSRIAVITEKHWLQKLSEIEGMLIPGLTIKAFDVAQEAEAEIWLAESDNF